MNHVTCGKPIALATIIVTNWTWFLIVAIGVVALILWLVPGIDATLRKLLIAICIVLFVVWLVMLLGGGSPSLP